MVLLTLKNEGVYNNTPFYLFLKVLSLLSRRVESTF